MSATLALISTPGIGSWLLTGVIRRSLMSIPPKPISTALPASCGAGFSSQKIACRDNDKRRIRLSRLKLRPIIDEHWRQRGHSFHAGRVCVQNDFLCQHSRLRQLCQLERKRWTQTVCAWFLHGNAAAEPSKSMIACTCPTPLAAWAKRGSGSIHKLPVSDVEIFAASTMLGADWMALVSAESFCSPQAQAEAHPRRWLLDFAR